MKCVVNFIHKLRPLLKGHIQNPLKKSPLFLFLSLSLSFSLYYTTKTQKRQDDDDDDDDDDDFVSQSQDKWDECFPACPDGGFAELRDVPSAIVHRARDKVGEGPRGERVQGRVPRRNG